MHKHETPTGKEKDRVNIIHHPKDEETLSMKAAKRAVIENNLKEKKYKHHTVKDVLHGFRIIFDRDKEGNLIPIRK